MPAYSMPTNIIRFERLGYLSVLIGLVAMMLENSAPAGMHLGTTGLAAMLGISGVLGGLLVWATARLRRNWLRILFVAVVAIGTALVAYTDVTMPAATTAMSLTLDAVGVVLDVTCVCLLFAGNSADWFRSTRSAPVTA